MFHRARLRRAARLTVLTLILALLAGLFPVPVMAAPDLIIEAESALLMDYATGQVLFAQNPDAPIPPASLTKLMTLHLAYKKLAEGAIARDDLVPISRRAWALSPEFKDSSVMFLEPGQQVTVEEIMKGIAIPSGNDAAVALAEYISGSVESFVSLMNEEAAAMGYKTMRFVDPHGLSPENRITAREIADFARRYIQMHPEALVELHSQQSYTYPQRHNLAPEKQQNPGPYDHPIPQPNNNRLLGEYEGLDGLKTGYIEEAGFNIVLTAKRGDMRLIAVVLGAAKGADVPTGMAKREEEGAKLLNWGFANFVTTRPELPEIAPVRVWKGAANTVALKPAQEILLTLEKGTEGTLTSTVRQQQSVVAPVQAGQQLGEIVFAADGREIAKFPLVAAEDVERGGFFKRIWDSIRLWIAGLFNR